MQEEQGTEPGRRRRRIYGSRLNERIAAIHPELSSVRVQRRSLMSAGGSTGEIVFITLLMAPFVGAIMERLGNRVTDLTTAAARKVVGRFLEERREALAEALGPQSHDLPRSFMLQVLVPGTGVVFELPLPDEQPEERAAAVLAMLDVDVSPLNSREIHPLISEECNVRWVRDAWIITVRSNRRTWGYEDAVWTPDVGAWLLPDGAKYPPGT